MVKFFNKNIIRYNSTKLINNTNNHKILVNENNLVNKLSNKKNSYSQISLEKETKHNLKNNSINNYNKTINYFLSDKLIG
jgi:hypothetical protein